MKHSVLAIASVLALTLGLIGCQREEAPKDSTASPSATSSAPVIPASLLDGPLPTCAEYIKPERHEYRVAALKDCASARTFDERMKSVGCQVDQRLGACKGMTFDMRDKDRAAAGTN